MAPTKKSKNKEKLPRKKAPKKPRGPVVKKAHPKQAQNIHSLQRALDESLAREAATSDILRMIAKAPSDLQTVLEAIAERAAKLCDAGDAGVWRVDGDRRYRVAHFGTIPTADAPGGGPIIDRNTPLVERSSTARPFMSMIFKQRKRNFRVPRRVESHWVFAHCSRSH